MMPYFSTSPSVKPKELSHSKDARSATSAINSYSFEVVAGDYVPRRETVSAFPCEPYTSKPLFSDPYAGVRPPPFDKGEPWTLTDGAPVVSGGALKSKDFSYRYTISSRVDAPSYDQPPSSKQSPLVSFSPPSHARAGDRLQESVGKGIHLYACRGCNADYPNRRQNRLHQDFKALPKEERQRLVEREAATSDLLARTVHLRFLPLTMLQSELGAMCSECGEYLRVRICGNSTNNQNWIYGFVEFATTDGAAAMMQRSGMELSNGPGRPPLRLKCNSAKQPIVDRVFHDADPETGNPCIFGLGNFAKRTLGDALESYYNLKEKEAQQLQVPQLPQTSRAVSPSVAAAAARPPIRLSPHARAFQPSSSPLLGVQYPLGAHPAPTDDATADTGNGHQSTPSRMRSIPAAVKADSEAASVDSATGLTSVFAKHCAANGQGGTSSSSGTTPHATLSPYLEYPTSSTTPAVGGAVPQTISGCSAASISTAARSGVSNSSAAVASPFETVGTTLCLSPGRGGRVSPEFFLPPSRETTALTHSDLAGNQLSLALQSWMLAQSATDGEEVLERGRELALRAISQAYCFLHSEQGFYDAMGTLRSLVELLDCHAAVTGGAVATGSGDHTAELPQRATQLRLLANLMMAFLYMMKRNLSDALPFIHAVVMSCNDIPVVSLGKTPSPQQQQQRQQAPKRRDGMGSDSVSDKNRWLGLAVGDGVYGNTKESSGYSLLGAPGSLLEVMLECIREEETGEEKEAKNALASNSHDGDGVGALSAEKRALMQRDQSFHRYVLKVLVAIGLSMEEVQPGFTRSTYALAAGRARDVLATSCPDLDDCLDPMTPNPHLCDRLYGPVSSASGSSKRDITFFPRRFFTEAEATRQEVMRSGNRDHFWLCLPPRQSVVCYSD